MGCNMSDEITFTEEERRKINELAARNYQDMSPDELELYTRWIRARTLSEEEFQIKHQVLQAKLESDLEHSNELHAIAVEGLQMQTEIALEFLRKSMGGDDVGEVS